MRVSEPRDPGTALAPVRENGPHQHLVDVAYGLYLSGDARAAVHAARAGARFVAGTQDRLTHWYLLSVVCLSRRELGEHEGVLVDAEQLLDLIGTSHPSWRAKALGLKAHALDRLDRTAQAIECLSEAQFLLGKHRDRSYAYRSAVIGVCLCLHAMRLYEAADDLLAELQHEQPEFSLYTASCISQGRALWGTLEELAGRPERAREHFMVGAARALMYRRVALAEGQDQATLVRATIYEAFAVERLGGSDAARGLLLPVGAGELGEDCDEYDMAYLTVGRIAVARGDLPLARDHFERVIASADRSGRDLWRDAAEQELVALEMIEHGAHPAVARASRLATALMVRLADQSEVRARDLRERTLTHQLRETSDLMSRAALVDALTGLANRRALELWMADVHGQHSAIFIDVDRFKQVNDTYSHQVGDQVLQQIARLLVVSCRAEDRIARYGGDEFFVVVEGGPHAAQTAGERIHRAVRNHPWHHLADGLHVTVSVGVAAHVDAGTMAMGLADGALYAAKRTGRDQVVTVAGAA